MTVEFKAWPKLPRLNRNAVVTEKIDGTNAAVIVEQLDDDTYWVGAQSRTRLITPGKQTDNYGFAAWVQDNSAELAEILGPGRHFGEWWGKGIQRGYDQYDKVFSLFNTAKWEGLNELSGQLQCVPILARWSFEQVVKNQHLFISELKNNGSAAATGYMNPEGFCVFHEAANLSFKVTLENDGQPKSTQ